MTIPFPSFSSPVSAQKRDTADKSARMIPKKRFLGARGASSGDFTFFALLKKPKISYNMWL